MAFRTNKTPVLQEKTASGSVATFNTALAMPLASCNVAVNAWQEGSGTPSPDNVRTINGYSNINISATGKNLVDFTARTVTVQSRIIDNLHLNKGDYRFTISVVNNSNINGVFAIRIGTTNIKTVGFNGNFEGIVSTTFNLTENSVINIILGGGSAGYSFDVNNAQIEIGTASTPYTPYSGSFTTITIGSTVYGGEYDARTGVLTVTHGYIASYNGEVINEPWISSMDKYVEGGTPTSGAQVVYPLSTPTTIQLPPCPIDTLEGVNNIWADTGDVDLTYYDLDIAKRGSFREVFKLP